jgi:hypothetical protein
VYKKDSFFFGAHEKHLENNYIHHVLSSPLVSLTFPPWPEMREIMVEGVA